MREYHDTIQDGECEREDIVHVCVCVHMTYIHEASHGNRSGRRFVQIITLNKMKERSTRIRERKGHEEVPFQHFGMNNFPST